MENGLKSKILNKHEIDWKTPIVLSELKTDPQVLEMHKQRINTLFANLPENERNQQLHNIVMRDNLFSLAMDRLVEAYEFDITQEDVDAVKKGILDAYGAEKEQYADEIARKIIMKTLIFEDLQAAFEIKMSDQELVKILEDYYKETNQPIRDFMADKERFEAAKRTLLEEKTVAFIIDKMPRDISQLEKKLYESLRELQEKEAKEKHEKEAAETKEN